jgi:hypothetical protein
MSRSLSHQWSDKKPFTRRARWYAQTREWDYAKECYVYTDIRLKFEDESGEQSKLYGDNGAEAQADWEAFKEGRLTTEMVRNKQPRKEKSSV